MVPTLTQAVNEHAQVHPGRCAIEDDYRSLTWKDLLAESVAMTRFLQERSVRRLGISAGNEAGHLVALIAAAAAEIPAVPVAPEWPADDIGRRFRASGVDHVLCSPGDEDRMRSVSQAPVHVVSRTGMVGRADKDSPSAGDILPAGRFDALHLISSTGGTSGKLKFAHLTHGNTVARFIAQMAEFGLRRRGRFLCTTPLFHGAGRSFSLSHLYLGGAVVLRERFEPNAWLREVRGCTASVVVPTMASRIVDAATARVDDSIVTVISGAKLDPGVVERWIDRVGGRMFNYYGSVEAGAMAVATAQEMVESADRDLVGMAAFGVHFHLLDAQAGAAAGAGSQVLVSGPGVAVAIETEGSGVIACEHVNPGDLLTRDARGYLQYKGRADDVLITGGVNVYPALVEDVFRQCDGVSEVALLGLPSAEWGHELVLAVMPRAATQLDEAVLRAFAKDRLARYAQPKRYRIMGEFPLTSAGKIDRRALIAMFGEGGA
ncbi:MAG: class I adenylate-forming enzyme family protein [Pseudomonadota bacterium]